jgi:hypothetical protein
VSGSSETCVGHVRRVTGLPHTSAWRRGVKVRDSGLASGVAIATFSDAGVYENDTSGRSHAAIFIEQTDEGIRVLDAWVGREAGERIIRFRGGAGKPVDDGDAYSVIETV